MNKNVDIWMFQLRCLQIVLKDIWSHPHAAPKIFWHPPYMCLNCADGALTVKIVLFSLMVVCTYKLIMNFPHGNLIYLCVVQRRSS